MYRIITVGGLDLGTHDDLVAAWHFAKGKALYLSEPCWIFNPDGEEVGYAGFQTEQFDYVRDGEISASHSQLNADGIPHKDTPPPPDAAA